MLSFFPMSSEGFLGTGAPFGADLNLVVQLIMGSALLAGARLARQNATGLMVLVRRLCFY